MRGSGLNISRLCDQCGSGVIMPRYAGPRVYRAEELYRAVSRQLDRGDGAAFDEIRDALPTARCPRCGADLPQQLMNGELPIKLQAHRFPKLDIFDPDFLATVDQQALLGALLDAALSQSAADTANVQLIDPARHGLYIAAYQGFDRHFLDFFEWVSDDGSACAAAAATGTAVMVPNVLRSPLFTDASKQAMLDARSYAVQSIPLLNSTGQLLGVFSCHYRRVGRPSDDVAPLLESLAKAAAQSLQWQAQRNDNSSHATSATDLRRANGRKVDHADGQPRPGPTGIRKIVSEIHRLMG